MFQRGVSGNFGYFGPKVTPFRPTQNTTSNPRSC